MHRNAAYCLRQYGAGYAYAAFATYGYACRPIGYGRYGLRILNKAQNAIKKLQ